MLTGLLKIKHAPEDPNSFDNRWERSSQPFAKASDPYRAHLSTIAPQACHNPNLDRRLRCTELLRFARPSSDNVALPVLTTMCQGFRKGHGRAMAGPWPGHGRATAGPWPGHGRAIWPSHGRAMAGPWPGHGRAHWQGHGSCFVGHIYVHYVFRRSVFPPLVTGGNIQ